MRPSSLFCLVGFLFCLVLAGCAAKGMPVGSDGVVVAAEGGGSASVDFEDYGDDAPLIADPWESWNRFWFDFNDTMIRRVAHPAWKTYAAVTPEPVRKGLSNAWRNLLAPVRILNRLLQGEFSMAWVEFDRFVVNTVFGGLGFGDVGSTLKPIHRFEDDGADFGHTLAVWGVGEGIYCVWPFIGPSTLRDTVGWVGDRVAAPTFWGTRPITDGIGERWSWIIGIGMRWNDLGDAFKAYEALTDGAVEPYAAVRDAYVTLRRRSGY